jgi:2'-5' RNA ligase
MCVRCFIAAELSEECIAKMDEVANKLSKEILRPTQRENMHITLKFLGDISDNEVELAKSVISECFKTELKIRANGYDAFPKITTGRVLFVKIISPELNDLAECMCKKTAGIGDDKKFVAHLTLGRAREREPIDLTTVVASLPEINFEEKITRITLKKSTLTSTGPIYENIFEKELP